MTKRTNPRPPTGKRSGAIDLVEVERLLAFMDKHGLEEFDYERDDPHIRLKKASMRPQGAFRPLPAPEIHVAGGSHSAQQAAPAATAPREAAADTGRSDDLHV